MTKSSSGEPHKVTFSTLGDCVRVFCRCPAGVMGWMCKHKLGLISGDASMLSDPIQIPLLTEIRNWPQFAMLQARVARYGRELAEIEAAKAEVATKEKALKSRMGKDLAEGRYTL